MKKLFAVLAVLFIAGTTSVFAKTGIGAQFGYVAGASGCGGALTFKTESLPCVFAVEVPSINPLSVGVTADWWIANPKIEGTWGYYYGVGASGSVWLGNSASIGIGGRALVGTNVFLMDDFIELYAQLAWNPSFWIATADGGKAGFDPISFPVNIGFRFWF